MIEHFWDGFGALASEMERVIQDGGYLFCSFPCMSPLRRAKAALGLYPPYEGSEAPADFYQFALLPKRVVEELSHHGFELVWMKGMGGLKGVQGELGPLSAVLARFYRYDGGAFLPRALRRLLDIGLSRAGFAHSMLLVLRRRPRLQL